MKFTSRTRHALAVRREARRMTKLGYRKHETDWELNRGLMWDMRITDARVSCDGKYVWTKIGVDTKTEGV